MDLANDKWAQFALLLIDVQYDFWPEQTSSAFPMFPANISKLLAFAREQELEIIHLRASFKADRSDWMVRYKIIDRRLPCIESTPGVEVLPCAVEKPGEKIIIKQTFDGFLNPELDDYLQKSGKRYLLLAGLVTSVCVLLTAASAAQRGYLVSVVEDCCADDPTTHDMILGRYPFIFERTSIDGIATGREGWLSILDRLN